MSRKTNIRAKTDPRLENDELVTDMLIQQASQHASRHIPNTTYVQRLQRALKQVGLTVRKDTL